MPHNKLKSQLYNQLGGINRKASAYITGPTQFLDLTNFDFQEPGALSQRWGSTQYLLRSMSFQFNGLVEYEKTTGESFVIFAGGSFAYFQTGTSFIPFRSSYAVGYTLLDIGVGVTLSPQNQNLNPYDYSFAIMNNELLAANGKHFWRFNGSTSYIWGLPQPFLMQPTSISQGNASIFLKSAGGSGVSGASGGMSGTYYYWLGYKNNRGYVGPSSASFTINAQGAVTSAIGGAFAFFNGATQVEWYVGATQSNLNWNGHGITSLIIYRTETQQPSSLTGASAVNYWLYTTPRRQVGEFPIGSTNVFVDSNNPLGDEDPQTVPTSEMTYLSYGSTFRLGMTYAPRYLEVYNNQLMMAGFSLALSSLYWTDIGDFEKFYGDNIELNTNDGDRITGIKAYLGRLFVFKSRSFFALSGTDPDNFQLNQVSNQYGCVSNRAIVVFQDTMMFLDRSGIMKFNGANIAHITEPVDDIFARMNVSAAMDKATAVHDKSRNQVMFSFPIDASTENNVTIVYDYYVNALTKYEGYNPSQYAIIQGNLSTKAVMYSNYSGLINWVGSTFTSDNGIGFTTYAKTRFFNELGESVEKQFRRLFVNFEPVVGTTVAMTVNMFKNYGTSIQITRTLYANQFQQRTDFGISGKSYAFELSKYDTTTKFILYGFAIDYRYQRSV